MPCLHNFCGCCFTEWMKDHDICPNCRNDVEYVRRNPTVENVVDKYLQEHPEKKRPDDEYK